MDSLKAYPKKHRLQGSLKRRLASKCLIVAFIVVVTTWISPSPVKTSQSEPPKSFVEKTTTTTNLQPVDPCDGKRVHMYDMPAAFNTQLLELCDGGLVQWLHFCRHYKNYGFGESVNSTTEGDMFQHDWYRTDAYMLEVIFFDRMRSYACLTDSPANADVFFVPYFSGLDALPYLYPNDTKPAQNHGEGAIAWLQTHATQYWNRFSGQDHFMIAGRTAWDFSSPGATSWGTHLFELDELRNVTFVVLERRPWRALEQAIPYPVGFHPSSASRLDAWIDRVRGSTRTALFSFSGALRPQLAANIRGILSHQCVNASTECARLDCAKISCSHNPEPIYESLLQADFCLQPRGDTATRRSTIDSIVSGCIPVLFHEDSAATQYLWHFPDEYAAFSVFIPEECIMNGTCIVRDILRAITPEQVIRMREQLISMIPSVLYKHPAAVDIAQQDAFDLTIEGMVRKVASLKESLKESLPGDSMR